MDLPNDLLVTWLLFILGGAVMLAVVTDPSMRSRTQIDIDARHQERSHMPRGSATARWYGKARARRSWLKRTDEAVA